MSSDSHPVNSCFTAASTSLKAEFFQMIAGEAESQREDAKAKSLQPTHVIAGLKSLEMPQYIGDMEEVLDKHTNTQKSKRQRSKSNKLEFRAKERVGTPLMH
jgi:hypothetical protein